MPRSFLIRKCGGFGVRSEEVEVHQKCFIDRRNDDIESWMKPEINEGNQKVTDEVETLVSSAPQIVLSQVEQTSSSLRLLRTSQARLVPLRHGCDSGDASIGSHSVKRPDSTSNPTSAQSGKNQQIMQYLIPIVI